jgi:uncharacterized protein
LLETAVSELDHKIHRALSSIRDFDGAVVALSAGVDSSLVAFFAREVLGDRAVAATGVSESLPPGELDVARRTAAEVGIRHVIIRTNELHNQNYSSNPHDRCYHCKDTLYHELRVLADSLKFGVILDGTHVDDLGDDRPGLKAAEEAGVQSPLLFAGFSKQDVRDAARRLGLTVWDKPAMPCLSSRIPHGEEITEDKLVMIGRAESFIKSLTGVRVLRVRYQQSLARIEVSPEERKLFFDGNRMTRIDEELRRIGFSAVTLDLRGYSTREGSAGRQELVLPMADAPL